MAQWYTGTSGFSYKDWLGTFYPETLPKTDFLPFYAQHFPFVELNFTYYKQPEAHTLEKMVQKTPEGFLFSVKAHKSLTHQREEDRKGELERYMEGIKPLSEGGRLSCILFQFPYSFHYTEKNRIHLAQLCDYLLHYPSVPPMVEFRNAEWSKESVYNELKERGIGFVVTDTPALRNLPPTDSVVTTDTAYVRFHGRNGNNWWTGDNTTRYDYLYSYEELTGLLPTIETMMRESSRLYLAFNNHHKGQAPQNAETMRQLITSRGEGRENAR